MRVPRLRLGPVAQGGLFYFSFYGAAAVYIPFLSVFYAHRGLSGGEIGLLAAVGPLATFLVAPGLAALADRGGWRVRLLVGSLVGTALSLLLLVLPTSFAGLVVLVTLLSVVSSPTIPVGDGLVAGLAARRGLAYGQLRLWGSLSWAVVAGAGGVLWQAGGAGLMFPLASVLILATVPIAQGFDEDAPSAALARTSAWRVLSDPRLRAVLAATFVLGLGLATAATFSGVYLDRVSGGQALVGLFSGLTALSELPIMQWSERIIRRLGGPPTLLVAYALMGGAYCVLAWVTDPILLLGAAVLQGLGFGLFLPTTVRLVAGWAPGEWATTAQSVISAAMWGLAPLIAGPLGGLIYDRVGPQAVFLACAAAATGAGLVLIVAQVRGVFAALRMEDGGT